MKNIIIFICVLLFIAIPCGATEHVVIDIYYPNDNMTTQIYYAEGGAYQSLTGNNVSGNFTAVILKNEMITDNIITSPHKIISPIFGLITLIIMIAFIVLVAKLIKRVWI